MADVPVSYFVDLLLFSVAPIEHTKYKILPQKRFEN